MSDYVREFLKGPEEGDPVHKPGDEGSCPDVGQSDGAPGAAPGFLAGPEEVQPVHKPGSEGSHSASGNVQGDQNVPPAPVPGEFLQGPRVDKTRVTPSHGDPGAGMGKGA